MLVILGVLASLAVPQFTGLQDQARASGLAASLSSLATEGYTRARVNNESFMNAADDCDVVTALGKDDLEDLFLEEDGSAPDYLSNFSIGNSSFNEASARFTVTWFDSTGDPETGTRTCYIGYN